MGFYIQDDFWEALEEQPVGVQNEVLGSLTRLFFKGDDKPPIKGVSKSLFVAFRDRVLLASKRSSAGRSKRNQTDDQTTDQNGNKTRIKTESNPGTNGDQKPSDLLKSESESKKKREKESKTLGSSSAEPRGGAGFAPPALAEVEAYAAEKGYRHFDAEQFVAFYESNGWKVGKNPMKSWKAAVTTWHRRDEESLRPKGGAPDVDLGSFAAGEQDVF